MNLICSHATVLEFQFFGFSKHPMTATVAAAPDFRQNSFKIWPVIPMLIFVNRPWLSAS